MSTEETEMPRGRRRVGRAVSVTVGGTATAGVISLLLQSSLPLMVFGGFMAVVLLVLLGLVFPIVWSKHKWRRDNAMALTTKVLDVICPPR